MNEINTGAPLYEGGVTDPVVAIAGISLLRGEDPVFVEQGLVELVGDRRAAVILAATAEEFIRA